MIECVCNDIVAWAKGYSGPKAHAMLCATPAGMSFMNQAFDTDHGGRDQWIAKMTDIFAAVRQHLLPGAHGFVWALPRTSHWTAKALENAGPEVRDCVTHIQGAGFPKSLPVSKHLDSAQTCMCKIRSTTGQVRMIHTPRPIVKAPVVTVDDPQRGLQ